MASDLTFDEFSGNILFRYHRMLDGSGYVSFSGEIPEEIIAQGDEAVRDYAQGKVDEFEGNLSKLEKFQEDIRKNPLPVETRYDDGTLLRGKIIEADTKFIRTKMDSPVVGENEINFGMASAMAKHHVFDGFDKISEHGYNAAHRCLRELYEDLVVNKKERDLVDRLNE